MTSSVITEMVRIRDCPKDHVLTANQARSIGVVDEIFHVESGANQMRELINGLLATSHSAHAAAKRCMALVQPSGTAGYQPGLDGIQQLFNPDTRRRVETFPAAFR